MIEENHYSEHSNPRKTRGKSPKVIRYEANEYEAEEEIQEYLYGTGEAPVSDLQAPQRYKP